MGGMSYLVMTLLTMMLVDVLMRVIELARTEEKASGMRNLAGLSLARRAEPDDDGQEKGGGGGVADEGGHEGGGEHDDEQDLVGAGVGLTEDKAPDVVGDAGAGEGLDHDEDAKDHDDGIAGKAGEGHLGGQEPGDDQHQQDAQGRNVAGDEFQREEDQSGQDDE